MVTQEKVRFSGPTPGDIRAQIQKVSSVWPPPYAYPVRPSFVPPSSSEHDISNGQKYIDPIDLQGQLRDIVSKLNKQLEEQEQHSSAKPETADKTAKPSTLFETK